MNQLVLCFVAAGIVGAPALAQTVHPNDLEQREGRYYEKGGDEPFTGTVEDPGVMFGRVEAGLRVGVWKGWHSNGQQAYLFEHENGHLIHRTLWHANGAKRMEGRFVEGRPDGMHLRWDEAGQKVSEEAYREGVLHGQRRLWDPDGHLLQEANYRDGQLHGRLNWYYADGARRWETRYDAGRRTGTWTQWTRNGQVVMQSTWQDDRLVERTSPPH